MLQRVNMLRPSDMGVASIIGSDNGLSLVRYEAINHELMLPVDLWRMYFNILYWNFNQGIYYPHPSPENSVCKYCALFASVC